MAKLIAVDSMIGEMGTSHTGRIAFINGIHDVRRLHHLTSTKSENPFKRSKSMQLCQVKADFLEMDLDFYLARHSILPFWHALPVRSMRAKTYRDSVLTWNKQIDGPIRLTSRFCRKCIDDDIKRVSFCWWHREHHVPGVDVCVHHGIPLVCVRDREAMWQRPDTYLTSPATFEELSPASNAAIVQRYQKFAIKLLERNEQFIADQILDAIRKACFASGIPLSGKGGVTASPLSLLARQLFPHDWLGKHYPALLASRDTIQNSCIDRTANGDASNGIAVTIILACLFGSVREFELNLQIPKKLGDVSRVSLDSLNSPNHFIKIFADADGDISKAAERSGLEPGVISIYRRKHGIPVLSKIAAELRREALLRLRRATPEELERWGQLMRMRWDEPNRGRGKSFLADVYAFLQISSSTGGTS